MNITFTHTDDAQPTDYSMIVAKDLAYTACEFCCHSIVDGEIVLIHDDHTFVIIHARCAIIATDTE